MPRPSRSDHALSVYLTAHGVRVTPYQVIKWRQLGLLPDGALTRLGRGGSSTEYPRFVLNQARAATTHVTAHKRRPYAAVLAMFGENRFAIPDHKLRRAYVGHVCALQRYFRKAAGAGKPTERAARVAAIVAEQISRLPAWRAWRARLPRDAKTPRKRQLVAAIEPLCLTAITGAPPTIEKLHPLLQFTGLASITRDPLPDTGDPMLQVFPTEWLAPLFAPTSFDVIRKRAEILTTDELQRALEESTAFERWARAATSWVVTELGYDDAFGLASLRADGNLQRAELALVAILLREQDPALYASVMRRIRIQPRDCGCG